MMSFKAAGKSWEPVTTDSDALGEARVQAHWAAQCVAAVGNTQVPARTDDSHASLTWHEDLRSLISEETPAGYRAGLRLPDRHLILLDGQRSVVEEFPVAGLELQGAIRLFSAAIERWAGGAPTPPLERPGYDMPEHALGQGGSFSPVDPEGARTLSSWYANGARFLDAVRQANDGASPVRCWPHHFDIATLITFDADREPGKARSVGVGLSPGDASYAEPYFYVNPWPPPESAALPSLDGPGIWHTEGWVGAVFPASRIGKSGNDSSQGEQVALYLRAALSAARAVLGIKGNG